MATPAPEHVIEQMAEAILQRCFGVDPPEAPIDLATAAYEAAVAAQGFRKEFTIAWEGDMKKDGSGRHQVQMGKFETQEEGELALKHISGFRDKRGVRVAWRWVSGWST